MFVLRILFFYNIFLLNRTNCGLTNSKNTSKNTSKNNSKSTFNLNNKNKVTDEEDEFVSSEIRDKKLESEDPKGNKYKIILHLKQELEKLRSINKSLQKEIQKIKNSTLEEIKKLNIENLNQSALQIQRIKTSEEKFKKKLGELKQEIERFKKESTINDIKNKQLEKDINNLKIKNENLKKEKNNLNNQMNIVNKKLLESYDLRDLLINEKKILEKLLKAYELYIKTLNENI
jgi:hypothetical protein